MMPGQEPYTPPELKTLYQLVHDAAEGDPGEEGEREVLMARQSKTVVATEEPGTTYIGKLPEPPDWMLEPDIPELASPPVPEHPYLVIARLALSHEPHNINVRCHLCDLRRALGKTAAEQKQIDVMLRRAKSTW